MISAEVQLILDELKKIKEKMERLEALLPDNIETLRISRDGAVEEVQFVCEPLD